MYGVRVIAQTASDDMGAPPAIPLLDNGKISSFYEISLDPNKPTMVNKAQLDAFQQQLNNFNTRSGNATGPTLSLGPIKEVQPGIYQVYLVANKFKGSLPKGGPGLTLADLLKGDTPRRNQFRRTPLGRLLANSPTAFTWENAQATVGWKPGIDGVFTTFITRQYELVGDDGTKYLVTVTNTNGKSGTSQKFEVVEVTQDDFISVKGKNLFRNRATNKVSVEDFLKNTTKKYATDPLFTKILTRGNLGGQTAALTTAQSNLDQAKTDQSKFQADYDKAHKQYLDFITAQSNPYLKSLATSLEKLSINPNDQAAQQDSLKAFQTIMKSNDPTLINKADQLMGFNQDLKTAKDNLDVFNTTTYKPAQNTYNQANADYQAALQLQNELAIAQTKADQSFQSANTNLIDAQRRYKNIQAQTTQAKNAYDQFVNGQNDPAMKQFIAAANTVDDLNAAKNRVLANMDQDKPDPKAFKILAGIDQRLDKANQNLQTASQAITDKGDKALIDAKNNFIRLAKTKNEAQQAEAKFVTTVLNPTQAAKTEAETAFNKANQAYTAFQPEVNTALTAKNAANTTFTAAKTDYDTARQNLDKANDSFDTYVSGITNPDLLELANAQKDLQIATQAKLAATTPDEEAKADAAIKAAEGRITAARTNIDNDPTLKIAATSLTTEHDQVMAKVTDVTNARNKVITAQQDVAKAQGDITTTVTTAEGYSSKNFWTKVMNVYKAADKPFSKLPKVLNSSSLAMPLGTSTTTPIIGGFVSASNWFQQTFSKTMGPLDTNPDDTLTFDTNNPYGWASYQRVRFGIFGSSTPPTIKLDNAGLKVVLIDFNPKAGFEAKGGKYYIVPNDPLHNMGGATGRLFVGLDGQASVIPLVINPAKKEVYSSTKLGIFAGIQAEGNVSWSNDYGGITLTGSGQLGYGAEAEGIIGFKDGVLRLSGGGKITEGLGLGAGVNVSVNVEKIATDAPSWPGAAVDWWNHTTSGVDVKNFFSGLKFGSK